MGSAFGNASLNAVRSALTAAPMRVLLSAAPMRVLLSAAPVPALSPTLPRALNSVAADRNGRKPH